MLKRWAAISLWMLLLDGTASAVTTVSPGGPIEILPGETVDIDLWLETDDAVGAINVEFFQSGGLTIDSCTDLGGVSTMVCSAIAGGFVANASDFVAGIPHLTDLVRLRVTAHSPGGTLTLGAFASTNFTLCPTLYPLCVIDGAPAALDDEGAVRAVVVVPEPATALLLSLGVLALAVRRSGGKAATTLQVGRGEKSARKT